MMPAVDLPLAWIDLGLSDTLYTFVRLAAALGGLIVGWFVTGPIVRIVGRVATRKAVPSDIVSWSKVMGAMMTAALIYAFFPLGGPGGGGLGKGGGSGDGFGKGKNNGKGIGNGGGDKKDGGKDNGGKREPLTIELLGGDNVKEHRYYLLDRKPPAVAIEEIEKLFQDKRGHFQVTIVLTKDSVGERHNAVLRLQERARKHGQFTLIKTEMSDKK